MINLVSLALLFACVGVEYGWLTAGACVAAGILLSPYAPRSGS